MGMLEDDLSQFPPDYKRKNPMADKLFKDNSFFTSAPEGVEMKFSDGLVPPWDRPLEPILSPDYEDATATIPYHGPFPPDQTVKLPTLDTAPDDLAHGPEVPHHRFSVFHECGQYAYARGLEVAPMHLPTALDAMRKSNWHLVAIFGQTDSKHIGFIFRRQDESISYETCVAWLAPTQDENKRLTRRVDDLLRANNDLVEQNRELRREINTLRTGPAGYAV